jgi:hypothetical protein
MVGMGGGLGFGVGGGGGGGLSWRPSRMPSNFHRSNASASGSDAAMDAENQNGAQSKPSKARFPLKAALTASVLATTGDTVAQLYDRYKKQKAVAKQAAVEVVELPPGRLQQVSSWQLLDLGLGVCANPFVVVSVQAAQIEVIAIFLIIFGARMSALLIVKVKILFSY